MMKLDGKKVLVIGLRRSGVAAARFLAEHGAVVTVTDKGDPSDFDAERGALDGCNVRFVLGEHNLDDFTGADLIVISPGVPLSIPPVETAKRAGVEVIGELELAARFVNTPLIGVTGTNGKSTVTELTGAMLDESGKSVFVGGNIGNPLVNLVGENAGTDIAIVEMSSFQLEAIDTFHPQVGMMLNISPDHLDRYADMQAYIDAKARIWKNMDANDWAVVNASDRQALDTLKDCKCRKLGFSIDSIPEEAPRSWIEAGELVIEIDGKIERIDASGMKIAGLHNLENALAAASAALLSGATASGIKSALDTFAGLNHRMQFIRELGDVKYYDDSKGTNVGALTKSLAGFDAPLVLIAGGLDKAGDFRLLRPLVEKRVKAIVLIGAATGKIKDALGDLAPTNDATDMKDAVQKARDLAGIGDVVLLSPGCASFDMFRDYVHRGEVFQEAVRGLE